MPRPYQPSRPRRAGCTTESRTIGRSCGATRLEEDKAGRSGGCPCGLPSNERWLADVSYLGTPPLGSRLRGNDGCATVLLRGNDGRGGIHLINRPFSMSTRNRFQYHASIAHAAFAPILHLPTCPTLPRGGKIPGRPEGHGFPAISAQMPALSVTVQSFSENNPWPTWRRGGFATRLPGAASFSSLAKVPRRVHLLESEQLPLSRGFHGSPGPPVARACEKSPALQRGAHSGGRPPLREWGTPCTVSYVGISRCC